MKSALPGLNVLLLGSTGVGKTYSIRTLVEAGITPMCLFTEPGFEVLGDIPADKLHWKYVPAMPDSLDALIKKVESIGTLDSSALGKMTDSNRHRDSRMMEFVKSLNNFVCDRTGESFGPVSKWGTDKALIIDSLSGLNTMAWFTVIGSKPVKDKPDYGKCQDLVESQVNWACLMTHCHFVLLAHEDRNFNEISGETLITPALPGKALTATFGRNFSDVIRAKRVGTEFLWSNADKGADLKARNLPISDKLKPSFAPMLEKWKSRGGIIEQLEEK